MKILMFDGNLVKDAEVKQTPKGNSYLYFRVGNTTYVRGENKTEFIDVVSFNATDIGSKKDHLLKGRHVFVSGTYDSSVNQSKDGRLYINSNVLADRIDFIGGGGKKDENNAAATDEPSIATTPGASNTNYSELEQQVGVTVKVDEAPAEAADASDEDDLPF